MVDKKKVQRVIGVVVILVIVIVVLPLFLTKKSTPVQPASTEKSSISIDTPAAKVSTDISDPDDLIIDQKGKNPVNINSKITSNMTKIEPVTEKITTALNQEQTTPSNLTVQPPSKHNETKEAIKKAWVVQMGSFKEKNNARRLADRLRKAGFKAFMHSVQSSKGERTRVYIGPEFKHAEAAQLSEKILQEFKLQGIVVSYKPLEL